MGEEEEEYAFFTNTETARNRKIFVAFSSFICKDDATA